jgi:hypothetical protein
MKYVEPVTVEECLKKAKRAMDAAGFKPKQGDHWLTASRAGIGVTIDCLQYDGLNAAYVCIAAGPDKADEVSAT